MGILSTIERSAARPTEARSGLKLEDVFSESRGTRSGVTVNEKTALNLSPVFAAVRRLSEDVAKTPRGVFERMERGRERRGSHHIDRLVSLRPNPEMTAFTFFEALQGHVATWGNAYAEKELDNAGRVLRLWPLTPDRVSRERQGDGSIVYWVTVERTGAGGTQVALSPERMLHVPGFGFDGQEGYSVIRMARESLGLTAATERFGAQHFGSGSRVAGVLQTEKKFSDKEDRERMRRDWKRMHEGLDNSHRVAILDQGMTWQQIGIPPEDAQFLETRKFQVSEVARWFLMPPHKLMDLERATFSNIEHQAIEYIQDTMLSWFTRWEQALGWDLFTQAERGRLYVRFNQNALLRGDSTARSAFYNQMFQLGALSTNDIRELEEMNPVEGGDERFVPMNMITLSQASEPPPEPSPPPPEPSGDAEEEEGEEDERTEAPRAPEQRTARDRRSVQARLTLRQRHAGLFEREATAVVRREADGIRAALRRAQRAAADQKLASIGHRRSLTEPEEREVRQVAADMLRDFIDELYEGHEEWVAERFLAVLQAYGASVGAQAASEVGADVPEDLDAFMRRYAAVLGRRWTGSSANQVRQLIREHDPDVLEDVLEERLAEWEEDRAATEAAREVVEAGEAASKFVWAAGGVTVLRWVAVGGGCPLCAELDGNTVGIEGAFLREGDELDPEDDETAPLRRRGNVTHPPLHRGCDCAIVPG